MMKEIIHELKKLNYTNPPEITETEDWHCTVDEVKSFIERKADLSLVTNEPAEFSLSSETLPNNRFYADVNTAHLECFFKKGSMDYLVVFFSGARSRAGGKLAEYPTFSSWSWYKDVDVSILCIDDPMYKTYPEMVIGWYYGTETEDYRYDTAVLIKRIAHLLGVPNKHIILYGRSGGGTAAIAVSDHIKGSCVCSINAQIDLQKYSYYAEQFAKFPEIDIYTSEDFKRRNDFAAIIKNNPQNTYLIITNIFSQSDAERSIPYFRKNFDIDIKYGISSDSNLFSWVYSAWGVDLAHNSFDSVSIFKIILEIIISISNGVSAEDANILAEPANDYWFERYNHLIKRSQYEKKIEKLERSLDEKNKLIAKYENRFYEKCIRLVKKVYRKIKLKIRG